MVVRVAEHACDDASKSILKPSTYRLQMLFVKDQYLRSLLLYGDQAIAGQLEKHVLKHMLAILTTYIETRPEELKFNTPLIRPMGIRKVSSCNMKNTKSYCHE